MKFFYKRIETAEDVKIVLKPNSLYIMLLMLALWLINDFVLQLAPVTQIIMPVFIMLMLVRFFSVVKLQKEVLVAMKQSRVKISGSKFSLSNPLTYTISKD